MGAPAGAYAPRAARDRIPERMPRAPAPSPPAGPRLTAARSPRGRTRATRQRSRPPRGPRQTRTAGRCEWDRSRSRRDRTSDTDPRADPGLEGGDGNARLARGTCMAGVVLRRGILRRREVGNAGIHHRLETVVDFGRGQDRGSRVGRQPGTPRERLARVAHVVDEQHAFSRDLLLVEATELVPALPRHGERGEAGWWTAQIAPAVEQAGDRVRQQRAAGDGAGHDVGRLEERAREHVQQILRETPDDRRVPQQLMRVQVDAPVPVVAEIEMPVEHEHLVVLQVLERLFSDLVSTRVGVHHIRSPVRSFTNNGRPPTIVAATPPRSSHPSNGVFFDRDRSARASTRTRRSGARIVMSAGAPTANVPPGTRRIRAGFTDSNSTRRERRMTPGWTRRSKTSGTAVSSPTIPKGARSNSTFFSS